MARKFTHAMVTVLMPLPEQEGLPKIPGEWFDNFPESAIYAADLIEEGIDLKEAGNLAGWALERKVTKDGWPNVATS